MMRARVAFQVIYLGSRDTHEFFHAWQALAYSMMLCPHSCISQVELYRGKHAELPCAVTIMESSAAGNYCGLDGRLYRIVCADISTRQPA